MTKTRFLTLVMALALLLAIPTAAFAQRVPPHVFVGSVTLDGATAADGAAVTAWIGGEQVAATTASGGSYSLIVDQGDSSYAGETVSFKVSGAHAAESSTWTQGGGDELNLVASSSSTGAGSGEKGAAGAKGAKGATGAAGPAGPAGADGAHSDVAAPRRSKRRRFPIGEVPDRRCCHLPRPLRSRAWGRTNAAYR